MLMGMMQHFLRKQFNVLPHSTQSELLIAVLAGAFSTPTLTPLEVRMVSRQMGQEPPRWLSKECFRGFMPLFFRQMGLGTGMLFLPKQITDQWQRTFPESSRCYPWLIKLCSGFIT